MNIIIFGPNGSGKGTQSSLIRKRFDLTHIESGDIFRSHISGGTELGKVAKSYMEKGELVPDEITIPMVLETLSGVETSGWLLDGFPRNLPQASQLLEKLVATGQHLDFLVELILSREVAKKRIMGRRICVDNSHHPNNIFIPEIMPVEGKCRVCGAGLKIRPDDQDEAAIDQRHNIYFDEENGTLAAVGYLYRQGKMRYVQVDASGSIESIREDLLHNLEYA